MHPAVRAAPLPRRRLRSSTDMTNRFRSRYIRPVSGLLALIHIGLGGAWDRLRPSPRLRIASLCLCAAACLLPLGFFLGGLFVYPPDPGLGIALVPIGGVFLFTGVALVARQT